MSHSMGTSSSSLLRNNLGDVKQAIRELASTFRGYAISTARTTIDGGENRVMKVLSEFKRLKPLTFDGVADLLVAYKIIQ